MLSLFQQCEQCLELVLPGGWIALGAFVWGGLGVGGNYNEMQLRKVVSKCNTDVAHSYGNWL